MSNTDGLSPASVLPLPEEPQWRRLPPLDIIGQPQQLPDGCIKVLTSAGELQIDPLACGVRLRFGPPAQADYGILEQPPMVVPSTMGTDASTIVLAWEQFRLVLTTSPLSFRLERGGQLVLSSATDGHFVREHRLPPFARRPDGGWFVSLDLASGEPVYGLGEKWGKLDKRGQLVRSLVFDALGVNSDQAYKNTPFAWSPGVPGRCGWGVFVNTPSPVTHAVGFALWSQRSYALVVEDEALDLIITSGDNGAELIGTYTAMTGRASLPPYWSLGAIFSRAYYRTADEILAAAHELRNRQFPCDTITFDGRAWQDTSTRFHFFFDPSRYPDVRPVLQELKSLGFRICVWEYPMVSVAGPYFEDFSQRGWLLRDRRTGDTYRYRFDPEPFGSVLTQLPDSGIVDFTNKQAFAWWRDAHAALFEAGVDMIKSDFGEQVEENCLASNGDTGHRLRNVYPMLYNRCVYEAALAHCPSGAFLFGRAGWAGSQRYPVQWGGDPQADWEGMAASIRGGLAWGLSGGPFHASDIGGFYKDKRDPELYVRWTQAAIFISHFRFHGIGAREPWTYGPEAEAAVRKALDLRYRLLPYLWQAVTEACQTGLPVHRAMVIAFPKEPATWGFEEQWMCGSDLLVAACPRPGGRVRVCLPAGRWYEFPAGGLPIEGGRVLEMELALGQMAVFAREDARLPFGPKVTTSTTWETGATPQIESYWSASTPWPVSAGPRDSGSHP